MTTQVTIMFRDGTKDWIDPVAKIRRDVKCVAVSNGIDTYYYEEDEILSVKVSELTEDK